MKSSRDFYPDCPEPMLVTLAREGDKDAFQQLVVRQQSNIRAMLRGMSGDPVIADDLAQQTFLQAFLRIADVKNEAAFIGWLKRIAVNMWLQHCRKHDLLHNTEDAEMLNENRSSTVKLDLQTALAHLSNLERLCITLSYKEGMSHREITDATELPLGTVKSHINRGTQKLNALLKDYERGHD